MANLRIIARLDIKAPNLIKGVHLEGLRVMGDPMEFARRYYQDGVDELIYMDTVASLYGRNNLTDIVKYTVANVFVPFTVSGGVRSIDDARNLLRAGADKIAINTAATKDPELLGRLAKRFGTQCIVLGVEARRIEEGKWICFTDNGREPTDLNVVEWAKRGADLGAGEILLTSVDNEGTRKGFDVSLVQAVSRAVSVPVIASGGMGSMDDFEKVVKEGGCEAVAIADALHYGWITVSQIRCEARRRGIHVRSIFSEDLPQ